jgi:hypothetical protein
VKKVDPHEARLLDKLIKKIDVGDGLTDDELAEALNFFSEVEWRLRLLGPHYHFAWRDAYFKLQRFEEFYVARSEKK